MLEAAATGVPAVAWDQPANKDVISADSTGILCPPGDVGAYSEAVAQLLGDAELNRRMAVAARAFVAQRYDSTVVVELLAELLAGLVAAGAPEPPAALAEINLSDGQRRRARALALSCRRRLCRGRRQQVLLQIRRLLVQRRDAAVAVAQAWHEGRRVLQHGIDGSRQVVEAAVQRDHSAVDAVLDVLDRAAAVRGDRPHPRSAASRTVRP